MMDVSLAHALTLESGKSLSDLTQIMNGLCPLWLNIDNLSLSRSNLFIT